MYSVPTLALTLCEKSRLPVSSSLRKLSSSGAVSLANLMT